jgi:hypothetical protein
MFVRRSVIARVDLIVTLPRSVGLLHGEGRFSQALQQRGSHVARPPPRLVAVVAIIMIYRIPALAAPSVIVLLSLYEQAIRTVGPLPLPPSCSQAVLR